MTERKENLHAAATAAAVPILNSVTKANLHFNIFCPQPLTDRLIEPAVQGRALYRGTEK